MKNSPSLSIVRPFVVFLAIFLVLIATNCSRSIPEIRPNSSANSCQKLEVGSGPEDFEIISSNGKDYMVVSSHERRIPNSKGNLYVIELSNTSLKSGNFAVQKLAVDTLPKNFHPHGISHSRFKGKNRLYVISHPRLKNTNPDESSPIHTIEVFEELPGNKFQWKHLKSLTDDKLQSPNDLFAMPNERLLISNDMGSELNFTAIVNLLFKRATTDITYYANDKFYLTGEKIPFGNGIWYEGKSAKSGILYRSSHVDQSIYVYSAEWVENHPPLLNLEYKIAFPGGPDNLYKNEYGFFTSVHPSDFAFLDHSKDSKNPAPSQIYKIQNKNQTKLMYSNSGKEISAASGAIGYKNKIFISQVFENFLLVCDN